jgi:hypothetical protein
LCGDDQAPPFSYVMVEGPVELSTDLDELRLRRDPIANSERHP